MFTKHVVKKIVVYVFLLMGIQQLTAHELHEMLKLPSDATVAETIEAYKKALDSIACMSIEERHKRRLRTLLAPLYEHYLEQHAMRADRQKQNNAASSREQVDAQQQ